MKTFTIKDVADAIRKNGLPQTFENLFITKEPITYGEYTDVDTVEWAASVPNDTSKITAGCALGQAIMNLGVTIENRWRVLIYSDNDPDEEFDPNTFQNVIINFNDEDRLSFSEIADRIEEKYASILDTQIEATEHEFVKA